MIAIMSYHESMKVSKSLKVSKTGDAAMSYYESMKVSETGDWGNVLPRVNESEIGDCGDAFPRFNESESGDCGDALPRFNESEGGWRLWRRLTTGQRKGMRLQTLTRSYTSQYKQVRTGILKTP